MVDAQAIFAYRLAMADWDFEVAIHGGSELLAYHARKRRWAKIAAQQRAADAALRWKLRKEKAKRPRVRITPGWIQPTSVTTGKACGVRKASRSLCPREVRPEGVGVQWLLRRKRNDHC